MTTKVNNQNLYFLQNTKKSIRPQEFNNEIYIFLPEDYRKVYISLYSPLQLSSQPPERLAEDYASRNVVYTLSNIYVYKRESS